MLILSVYTCTLLDTKLLPPFNIKLWWVVKSTKMTEIFVAQWVTNTLVRHILLLLRPTSLQLLSENNNPCKFNNLKPRVAEVVLADLVIFRCFLAALTSSAYCLDPTYHVKKLILTHQSNVSSAKKIISYVNLDWFFLVEQFKASHKNAHRVIFISIRQYFYARANFNCCKWP